MDDDDMVLALSDLLQTAEERTRGFAEAVEASTIPKWKTLFQQSAVESSTAGIELRCLLQRLGATLKEPRPAADPADRAWPQTATPSGAPSIATFEKLARAADRAKAAYARALLAGFPRNILSVLQRQHEDVLRNHALIQHRNGEGAANSDEQIAIGATRQAAVYDGKDSNYQAPPDVPAIVAGQLRQALNG